MRNGLIGDISGTRGEPHSSCLAAALLLTLICHRNYNRGKSIELRFPVLVVIADDF